MTLRTFVKLRICLKNLELNFGLTEELGSVASSHEKRRHEDSTAKFGLSSYMRNCTSHTRAHFRSLFNAPPWPTLLSWC